MLLTLLLMSLSYPCKLLVEVHHVSMGRMKVKTILYTTWLDNTYLKLISMQINGYVQLENLLKYIDAR